MQVAGRSPSGGHPGRHRLRHGGATSSGMTLQRRAVMPASTPWGTARVHTHQQCSDALQGLSPLAVVPGGSRQDCEFVESGAERDGGTGVSWFVDDVFTSVADLTDAITTWAEHWNEEPKPFVWKTTAEDIIAKVQRGRSALHKIKSQTDH